MEIPDQSYSPKIYVLFSDCNQQNASWYPIFSRYVVTMVCSGMFIYPQTFDRINFVSLKLNFTALRQEIFSTSMNNSLWAEMHKWIKIYICINQFRFAGSRSACKYWGNTMQKKRNSANLLFFKYLLKIISGHETLPVNFLCYFTKHSD